MDRQDVFNRVVAHANTQKEFSRDVNSGQNLYYSPNNRKCFIGIFIKSDKYRPEFELHNVQELPLEVLDIEVVGFGDWNYLRELQLVHDSTNYISDWNLGFYRVARAYGLSYKPLLEYKQ